MTQGFYELLSVPPDASAETLRQAYHRQVAKVAKRQRELASQGGDTSQFELARAQLDEAWSVLSVPSRRQRYDAMLNFIDGSHRDASASDLWQAVKSDLVPPSVAAAVRLLADATDLAVPRIAGDSQLPEPEQVPEASTMPTLAPSTHVSATHAEEAPTAVPGTPTPRPIVDFGAPRPSPVVKLTEVSNDLRVVDGKSTDSGAVIVLPQDAPRQKTLSTDIVSQLTDTHGYSGSLLRAVREAKGITLQQVADSTRISVRYLEAIEADAHERLPSAPFVKGYVREVARMLKLDDEAVVAGYMRRLTS